MYRYADRAIRAMNRRNVRLFDKLRTLAFDELNIIRTVSTVYTQSMEYAEKQYLAVAVSAYSYALSLVKGAKRRKCPIDRDWILDYLEEFDPVTLYRFVPETDRKKERLAEALVSAGNRTVRRGEKPAENRKKEIDKALRYWTLQLAQYAVGVTDKAAIQAYKDAGVKYVKWNTEKDQRVCDACHALDGKVFPIYQAPDKQHVNCRCWYSPVVGKS